MKPLRPLSSIVLLLILLAACGQKGALYLPGDPDAVRSEVPAADAEPADEDEDDPQP